jgi:hypothetical protein
MYHQQHTQPALNHLTATQYSQKQNFSTSPKPNFDNINWSDERTSVVIYRTSLRVVERRDRGEDEG